VCGKIKNESVPGLPQFPAESLNRFFGGTNLPDLVLPRLMGRLHKGWRTARQDLNIVAAGDFQGWGAA